MYRLTSVDYDLTTDSWMKPFQVREVSFGETVEAGRESEFPVGIDPVDSGVSRQAATVRPGPEGWEISLTNSNHGWLHPWAQTKSWIERGSILHRQWPRIGILLTGTVVDNWYLWAVKHGVAPSYPQVYPTIVDPLSVPGVAR